jgi:hypothetical protein
VKVIQLNAGLLIALVFVAACIQVRGANIDVSGIRFNSLGPNPIAPGQHPNSFGVTFD